MGGTESAMCSPITNACHCVSGDQQHEFDDNKEDPMPGGQSSKLKSPLKLQQISQEESTKRTS